MVEKGLVMMGCGRAFMRNGIFKNYLNIYVVYPESYKWTKSDEWSEDTRSLQEIETHFEGKLKEKLRPCAAPVVLMCVRAL